MRQICLESGQRKQIVMRVSLICGKRTASPKVYIGYFSTNQPLLTMAFWEPVLSQLGCVNRKSSFPIWPDICVPVKLIVAPHFEKWVPNLRVYKTWQAGLGINKNVNHGVYLCCQLSCHGGPDSDFLIDFADKGSLLAVFLVHGGIWEHRWCSCSPPADNFQWQPCPGWRGRVFSGHVPPHIQPRTLWN